MGIGLRLGPLLRHVSESTATIWVETDAPCRVTVAAEGHTAHTRTFSVHGHHYALCDLAGLPSGAALPYEVLVDGETAWPRPGDNHPPSLLRTLDPAAPSSILFGSCHTPTDHSRQAVLRYGVDMLRAYALRLASLRRGSAPGRGAAPAPGGPAVANPAAAPDSEVEPSLLLLIGDQVYADEIQPSMKEFLAHRRAHARTHGAGNAPPDDEVVSFDEYAELYRQAWSDPDIRWLLSTVPTLMLFDDHDIRDDWNTSGTWRAKLAATQWWRPRITSGLGAYWIYQHLGNLSPDHRAADPIFSRVAGTRVAAVDGAAEPSARAGADTGQGPQAAPGEVAGVGRDLPERPERHPAPSGQAAERASGEGAHPANAEHGHAPDEPLAAAGDDAAAVVDAFAWRAHQEADSYRWSFRFDIGRNRLLMVDGRCGRVVEDDTRRSMMDPEGAAWFDAQLTGDVDHLVVASTLPFLLPMGVHHVEAWNEAVCAGAWGQTLRGTGEKLRQGIDLEHWAAFQSSFQAISDSVLRVAAGERGSPPATVLFLGGDVHFSYLARARAAGKAEGEGTRIAQLVCSPTCNWMPPIVRRLTWIGARGVTGLVGALMARTAGVPRPALRWRLDGGPWYDNSLAALVLDGRRAEVTWSYSPQAKRAAQKLTPNESPRPTVREMSRRSLTG